MSATCVGFHQGADRSAHSLIRPTLARALAPPTRETGRKSSWKITFAVTRHRIRMEAAVRSGPIKAASHFPSTTSPHAHPASQGPGKTARPSPLIEQNPLCCFEYKPWHGPMSCSIEPFA